MIRPKDPQKNYTSISIISYDVGDVSFLIVDSCGQGAFEQFPQLLLLQLQLASFGQERKNKIAIWEKEMPLAVRLSLVGANLHHLVAIQRARHLG